MHISNRCKEVSSLAFALRVECFRNPLKTQYQYSNMAHENLYDSLGYNIPDDDLSAEEKQSLTDTITTLDAEKKELIYLLVLHDYVKSNPNTKVIFPYKCKQVTNDRLEIKVDALPIRLKRILYKFSKLAEVSAGEPSEQTPTPST
jgi:hypothetical protein